MLLFLQFSCSFQYCFWFGSCLLVEYGHLVVAYEYDNRKNTCSLVLVHLF